MHSTRSGELISMALQATLISGSKKYKVPNIDDHIVASARRVLSTKIEYVHCPQYSTSSFLDSLKSKYPVLKSNRSKKKKRKKNKHKSNENSNSKSPMKNTEFNDQNLSLPTPKVVLFPAEAVQLGWRGTLPVGSGFVNLGTTCYINSTLQALFHVPSFVNWLMEDKKHLTACEKMNGMMHTECIVCAMSKTLHMSHRANGNTIRPKYIIDKVKTICKHLSPFRQEDAHEFLRYLMEAMEKSYTAILGVQANKLDNFSKETTPLNQIFGGYIRTEVTCLECNHVSTTFQHFQDLILDIRQASTSTVYDALENYFSKERLDGDESYHCERCKKKVSAYKKFSVERAPNALCIQLKRFNLNSFGGSKISKSISTPHNIDLTKFKHKKGPSDGASLKYRLVSMVFHHGPSSNSGHYTALGCTSSGSYYYFNDEQVFPVHLNNFTNNPNAYIMFYEREKSSLTENSNSITKPAVNTSVTPSSNSCMNGNVQQRRNGFFTKRENSFSSSSNHTKQPSWEPVVSKPVPVKSSVTVAASSSTAVIKSTPNSLVPYAHSSDSEVSDSESNNVDTNNNSRSSVNEDNKNAATGGPSVLAKKNSTLTSLLTSSPKNENTSFRITSSSSSPRLLSNCKPLRLESMNSVEDSESSCPPNGKTKAEKRGLISFNLFNRGQKRIKNSSPEDEEAAMKTEDEKPKSAKQILGDGVASMYSYLTGGSGNSGQKKEAPDKHVNGNLHDETNQINTSNEGLTNGIVKQNGMVNGTSSKMNGWLVTEIEDGDTESNDEKYYNKTQNRGDWVVTEKGNRKSISSPPKETKSNDSRKYCGNNHDIRNENSVQNDSQNGYNNYSTYSSHNGYGGRVLTWNGDLSKINKESENDRRELCKRSYSYDDEMDRGKIKKTKYFNRNEDNYNAQSPRKNPIQQFHNQSRGKRPPWQFSQNSFNYHNRRFSHNSNFRSNGNYYNSRTGNNCHQNNWR